MSVRRFLAPAGCVCLLLLLVAPVSSATPLYKPARTYISGPCCANAIAVADLNGDGKPDIIVGSNEAASAGFVGVLLGSGEGRFRATQNSYGTGGHGLTQVLVADLNGDGKPDVVVSQMEGVAVLLGNGDGSFQAATTIAIDSFFGTSGVAAADVNGDGKLDLLVAAVCFPGFQDCNHKGGAVVLLGNGDGTFGPPLAYGTGGNYPTCVAVADVNLDGKLDLVLDNSVSATGYEHGSVAILLGNGDGTFQTAQDYDQGGFNGGRLTVADVNGDGNPDVIAVNVCANANCNQSTMSVLLGKGDGTLQEPKIYFAVGGWWPNSVAVADVNRDGTLDVIVGNECDNSTVCDQGTVAVLLGKGDGTFSLTQKFDSGGAVLTAVAVNDVNGDGIPDIFASNLYFANDDSKATVGVLLSLSPTATNLTSSPNPSIYGQAVALTSTVTSPSMIPRGTVEFNWGSHTIGSATLNSAGVATLTYSKLGVGTDPIIAVYAGDANNLGSSSPVVNQEVQQATSAAGITSTGETVVPHPFAPLRKE